MVSQTQQQLLTTAQATARSLENFITAHSEVLHVISRSPLFRETIGKKLSRKVSEPEYSELKTFYKIHEKHIGDIGLLDSDGTVLCRYPFLKGGRDGERIVSPGVAYVLKEHKAHVSSVFHNRQGAPAIFISEPIFYEGEFAGIVRWMIRISTLTERFIQPVKAGKGYASLMDDKGELLYHPRKDFKRLNAFQILERSKKNYPDYDWSGLSNIMERASEGKEGVSVYYGTKKLKNGRVVPMKKIAAYTPVHIGEKKWSVSAAIPYSEITGPIYEHAGNTFGLAALAILLLGVGGAALFRSRKEAKYLKEIARSAEALGESEEYFQSLLRSVDDVVWAATICGSEMLYINPAVERVYGMPAAEFFENPRLWLEAVHPEDQAAVKEHSELMTRGQTKLEYRIIRPDGEVRWLYDKKNIVFDESDNPVRMGGIVSDITLRKQAEQALHRVNRALKTRSECNREIVHATNETDLLNRACRIVVEIGGYRLAWIGYAENDEMKTVRPAARHGYDGYIDTANVTRADTERGRGPAGTAIRTRKPAFVRHIMTDPDFIPWRAQASSRGYSSALALPLCHNGDCIGTLNIYAAEPDAFDTDELDMLEGLADDLAHGIIALRMRRKRREAEEALGKSEGQKELILSSMPDMVLQVDTNLRILWANKTALDMNPAAVGKTCHEAYPGKNRSCDGCPSVKSLETGQTETATIYYPFIKCVGDEGYFEKIAVPLKDDQGNVTNIIEIIRDVTEKIMNEKVLEKQRHDLRERVKELQCLYNIANIVETPGITLKEIFQKIADMIPFAWQYPEITCARFVVEGEEFKTQNFRETFWKQSASVILADEEIGVLDVCYLEEKPEEDEGPFLKEERDLTEAITERVGRIIERERARKALEELNLTLEKRTEQLEEVIDELKSFSYSVSHDLRAPLRAVNGFAQMLYEVYADKFDEDARHYLEVVRNEAVRMGQLIDDLLAFSRLSRQDIRAGEVNVNELIDEVIKNLQFSEDGIKRVRFDVNPNLPSCQGDLSMLRQVWVNLLSNAVKYSGHRQEPVVETGFHTDDENRMVYFVRDNGTGFNMKYYDKLFGVFQRLHSPDDFPGTGIGLAIAKRIIQRHGGRIWAESELGKGTIFYFYLSPQPQEKKIRKKEK